MDKIATNNHVVMLRKEIKKAKAMVAGNLVRKINKLKQEKDKKEDDKIKLKILEKIEKIHSEIKLLKSIDTYQTCKKATLNPCLKYWNDVIADPKSTAEQRLSSRIICKNTIQKQVSKFRSDHNDCDEWLEEYFEFREKKKELEQTSAKSKAKSRFKKEKKQLKGRALQSKDDHPEILESGNASE